MGQIINNFFRAQLWTDVGSVDWDWFFRKLVNLLSHSALPITLYVEAVFRGRSSRDRCDSDRLGATPSSAPSTHLSRQKWAYAEIRWATGADDYCSQFAALQKQGQRVNHDAALRPVFDPAGSERLDSTFEPVLTTDEAAVLLQIHPKTLQRMARRGVVPAFRIGDLWRFRASDLDRWLRSGLCSKGHSCR